MLDDERTEQTQLVIDDVAGIGAQVELGDRTLEVAGAGIAHGGQGLEIVLAQTEIVDDETLQRHKSGEILNVKNGRGKLARLHIAYNRKVLFVCDIDAKSC